MRPNSLSAFPLILLGLAVAGASCGDGGRDLTGSAARNCPQLGEVNALCVQSCNLGCTLTGCNISDIAVNQPLIFRFNQAVDPASVTGSTFMLRSMGGSPPVGDFAVQGDTIFFFPAIQIVGGATSFGFQQGARYSLTLPGGRDGTATLRSTRGDPLVHTLSCVLNVTRGVQDLDGQPPRPTLISPQPRPNNRIPVDSVFVIEFSELIDVAPFQGTNPSSAPVTFTVFRAQVPDPPRADNSLLCLDRPFEVAGTVRTISDRQTLKTSVVMTPDNPLPSEVCVVVEVTSRVRDLSGKPASRTVYRLYTDKVDPIPAVLREDFTGTTRRDTAFTGAIWEDGKLKPGLVGGSGIHGEFVAADGRFLGESQGIRTYEWSTDLMRLRPERNHLGIEHEVRDGVFQFSSLTVEEHERVVWGGNRPPQIFVRGQARILGTMEVDAPATAAGFSGESPRGQEGGRGGPGGARGGAGADKPGTAGGSVNGRPGEDVVVPSGHPHAATRADTGGGGALAHPPGAQGPTILCGFGNVLGGQMAAGGAGGSLFEDFLGSAGAVTKPMDGCATHPYKGPDSIPGTPFQLLPFSPSGPLPARTHFLIGGSGGGGGGAHPYWAVSAANPNFRSAAGGAGGGGAMLLRAGGGINVGSQGRLSARGGRAGNPQVIGAFAAPGGGGSGGSILLQSGTSVLVLAGALDVRGGAGGVMDDSSTFNGGIIRGGDGGAGYVRVEAVPAPSPGQLSGAQPPASAKNVGLLTDRDLLSAAQSRWIFGGSLFPPRFLRFEIDVIEGTRRVTYSDDPSVGIMPQPGTTPIEFWMQGAEVSPSTLEPDPPTITSWERRTRDIDARSPTGIRWLLILDREKLGAGTPLEVEEVRIFLER